MSLHSSALALAPTMAAVAPTTSRSSAVSMAYENELGATGPLGMCDPLGLVSAAGSRPVYSGDYGGHIIGFR